MKQKKLIIGIAAVVVLALVGIGIFRQMGKNEKPGEKEVIKIGAILPLTGDLSYFGEPELSVLKMQVDSINSAGGINGRKVELLVEDSKSNSKDGVNAVNKLILSKPTIVISSMTMVSYAVQPILLKNSIPQIALSVHPDIAQENDNTIRPYYGFDDEMLVICDFLVKSNIKSLSVLWINVPECEKSINEILIPALSAHNITLFNSVSYNFGETGFNNLITKVNEKNPDKILVMDYGDQLENILNIFTEKKIRDKIVGNVGFLSAPNVSAELINNIPFAGPSFIINDSKEYEKFSTEFYNKTKFNSTYDVIFVKDAIDLAIEGLIKSDLKKENFITTIKKLKTFTGICGKMNITDNGNISVEISMGYFKNGTIFPVKN